MVYYGSWFEGIQSTMEGNLHLRALPYSYLNEQKVESKNKQEVGPYNTSRPAHGDTLPPGRLCFPKVLQPSRAALLAVDQVSNAEACIRYFMPNPHHSF